MRTSGESHRAGGAGPMADDRNHWELRLLRLRERTIHMGVGRVVEARESAVGPLTPIKRMWTELLVGQ